MFKKLFLEMLPILRRYNWIESLLQKKKKLQIKYLSKLTKIKKIRLLLSNKLIFITNDLMRKSLLITLFYLENNKIGNCLEI
jgi:hypothetical protein